jgi:predicted AlkP superfamily pyrophosphatase or phosphodiesterase
MRRCLLFILLIVPFTAPAPANTNNSASHVILVSIDGLRPDVYLRPQSMGIEMPNLTKLATSGTVAERMTGVFPSITYPSHTSLVTGNRPARHGITTNPNRDNHFWESGKNQSPTLWDSARDAGLTTALVTWPASKGANVDFLVSDNLTFGEDGSLKRFVFGASEELWMKLAPQDSPVPVLPFEHEDGAMELDLLTVKLATGLIIQQQPQLLLVHFLDTDHRQHQHGTDHPMVRKSFEFVDGLLGEILAAVDTAGIADSTNIIVVGDHGFLPAHTAVNAYAIYKELLKGTGIEGMIFTTDAVGGVIAIHARKDADPDDIHLMTDKTRNYVNTRLKGIVNFLDKQALAEIGSYPKAEFALVASPGYMLITDFSEQVFLRAPLGGVHGSLPSLEGLQTGFVAAGPDFREGYTIPQIRTIDVAPTIARIWEARQGQPECRFRFD